MAGKQVEKTLFLWQEIAKQAQHWPLSIVRERPPGAARHKTVIAHRRGKRATAGLGKAVIHRFVGRQSPPETG
jgi:hypothetical protein